MMPAHHIQRRQWLVTTLVLLLHTVLLPLLFWSNPAEAAMSSSARSRNRKDNAAYYHSARARRQGRTHGAQFGNFLVAIQVVVFFSVLPVLVFFVWSVAADPDTPRILRCLYAAARKKVFNALGWPSPHVQPAVSAPEHRRRGREEEEEGGYFGDPMYADEERRKDL